MTPHLQQLIQQASTQLGAEACREGRHTFVTEGGRSCSKGYEDCSQPVYVCSSCGAYDYGEAGGPGHQDCYVGCARPPVDEGS